MNKQNLPSLAMLMICLIIMFPFCSSAAMADIRLVKTYDDNYIEGFMKTGNDLTVKAYAKVVGDEDISASQLKLGQIQFDICGNPDPDNVFQCLITIPTEGFLLDKPSHTYTVKLYNDGGDLVDTEPAIVAFDDLAPSITYFGVPSLVGSSSFDVSYSVRDPTNSDNACSGIGWIEVYINQQVVPYITEMINSSSCYREGSISIEGTALNDGVNTIKLIVYDRMKQQSPPMSRSLTAELSEIFVNSVEMFDSEGNIIEWFVPEPIEVVLVVNFSGPAIIEESVEADLSALNPGYESALLTDSCTESGSITICRWDITVDIPTAKTAVLVFGGEDYAGNDFTKTSSILMRIDTQGPSVTSLNSELFAAGINYARPLANKFTARIVENAILDKDNIRLYIGDISKGIDNYFVKPTSCSKLVTGSWECNFTGIDLSALQEDRYQAYIFDDSTDKYGNPFVSNYSIDFTVDTTPPEIVNVSVKIISGAYSANRSFVQIGDSLEINAELYEENALGEVYGDFSSIISESGHEIPSCSRELSLWTCKWETDVIDVPYYKNTAISLYFSDAAGNPTYQNIPIEVMGVEETEMTLWEIYTTSSSPDAIDRQITTLYNPFMWFVLDLQPSQQGIVPVDVTVEECFDTPVEAGEGMDEEEAVSHVAFLDYETPWEVYNYNTINTPQSSAYPLYIKFNLIQAALEEEDALKITCRLRIRGIKGQQTIIYSPDVNASFEIKYFNNPIGTIDKNIEEEINRTKESWLVQAEWLGSLNKILNYGRMVCELINTWASIQIIWATIKDIKAGACDSPLAAWACPSATAAGVTVEGFKAETSEFYRKSQKYCRMLSCTYSWHSDTSGKDSLMDIVSSVTGGAGYTEEWQKKNKDRDDYFGNINTNPSSSLVLSMLYLCLPGVIYNLQKARTIDCIYINCLEMVEQGMPISLCTSQRSYAYCKFVWGEIFNLIPFASAISAICKNILKALSHPYEFVGFAVNMACSDNYSL